MNDLTIILPKLLQAITNTDDLEFKLCQAIEKSYKPGVEARVSKMTSNKVCLNLVLGGYIEADRVERMKKDLVETVVNYFGWSINEISVVTSITCTLLYEYKFGDM